MSSLSKASSTGGGSDSGGGSGILRKAKGMGKGKGGGKDRNVSFQISSRTSEKDHGGINGGGGSRHEKQQSKKGYRDRLSMLNDDEEDAFDPQYEYETAKGDDACSDEQKIRDAKSKRALKRIVGGSNRSRGEQEDDDGDDVNVRIGSEGTCSGEEVADEHHSLLHEQNYTGSWASESGNEKGQGQLSSSSSSCPIEPFNLTSEREDGTGYFDGDTYVFRKGRGVEEEDAWLDGLDENDKDDGTTAKRRSATRMDINSIMMRNKTSKRNREANANGDGDESRSDANNALTIERIYDELNRLLASDSETVMQALSRYGTIIKREKNQRSTSSSSSSSQGVESASKKALNRLTELSNLCMMKFDDHNIYEHDRKYLQDFLSRSDQTEQAKRKRGYFGDDANDHGNGDDIIARKRSKGDDGASTTATNMDNAPNNKQQQGIKWEYKGNQDGSIHGPYTTKQMLDWIKMGYFVGDMAVDVRIMPETDAATCRSNEAKPKSKEEVMNDLLGDLEDSDDDEHAEASTEVTKSPTWLRSDEVDFSTYL